MKLAHKIYVAHLILYGILHNVVQSQPVVHSDI